MHLNTVNRADMQRVLIVKDTYLPRFTLRAGSHWDKQKMKMSDEGFECGQGFIPRENYELIDR